MDISVPPVIREEFVYRDTLLVDVGGDLKRHPRASVPEIKSYLEGKAGKDQVAHWYEAQVIHYGLQRTRDKNTAKVRLQQALGQKKLSVPPHITDMEAQMKKDYASNVRKAKAAVSKAAANGELSTVNDSGAGGKGKKRKQEDEEMTVGAASKKTRTTMRVGDMEISIGQISKEGSVGTKKRKSEKIAKEPTATPKPSATKASGKSSAAHENDTLKAPSKVTGKSLNPAIASSKAKATSQKNDQQSAKAPAGRSVDPSNISKSPSKPQKSTKVKAVASKSDAASSEAHEKSTSQAKAKSKTESEPKVKAEPEFKKECTGKKGRVKKEPKVKAEHSSYSPIKDLQDIIDPDGDLDMDCELDEPSVRNITGVYNIICPRLADQIPKEASSFRLFLCVDNDAQPAPKIWGGFQLGYMSGVLLTQDSYAGSATSLSFGWRARNGENGGQMSFGRGCFGEMTFFGVAGIIGAFHNLFPETVEFQGERRPGPLWCGRPAWKFEEEWDGFVKEAYGR